MLKMAKMLRLKKQEYSKLSGIWMLEKVQWALKSLTGAVFSKVNEVEGFRKCEKKKSMNKCK